MAQKDAKGSGFNTPFQGLKEIVKKSATGAKATTPTATATATGQAKAGAKTTAKAAAATSPPPAASSLVSTPASAVPARKMPARSDVEDDQFFARAMRGVTPLTALERGRRASPLGPAPAATAAAPRRRAPTRNDDADAEAELADLVTGGRPALDEDAPGAHAGRAPGIDRRLLRRLRDGEYPVEARLDLHGRARDEAESVLERFVAQSQGLGRRCVLVIHGRGLNSGDAGPVLRDATQRILSGGRVARAVLAFTLAAAAQGGEGATLVLLRKAKQKQT